MKRKNRIRGMITALFLLFVGATLLILNIFEESAVILVAFATGWALRETLQPLEETEE